MFASKPISVFLMMGLGLLAGPMLATPPPSEYDMVVYRPTTATFYVKQQDSDKPATELPYGTAGDVPLWADFNGDGKREQAVYRKGLWFISARGDGHAGDPISFGGEAVDVPLVADVDGDGKADLVIYRAGDWYVRGSRNPAVPLVFHFGAPGDIPLLGDFDGDGKVDLAVFRAGQWFVDTHRDGKAELTFHFGAATDRQPLAAGWVGHGHSVPALFRDGEWLISLEHDGNVSEHIVFGMKGDIPLAVEVSK